MSAQVRTGRVHPVHYVHRVGAAVLGVILVVFAVLGYADGLAPFSTQGRDLVGLSTNGLLSTISVVAALVLFTAAAIRGPVASTTTAVMGGLFLASGLLHLAILRTSWNVLDFGLTNVYFSLVAGMGLLFLGLYGRLSGGLPADNPYRVQRTARRVDHEHDDVPQRPRRELERELFEARRAVELGQATPEQQALLSAEERHRAAHAERGELEGGAGADRTPGRGIGT